MCCWNYLWNSKALKIDLARLYVTCQWKPIAQAHHDGGQQNLHAIVLYLYEVYEELEEEWCPDGEDPLIQVREAINKKAEG